MFTTRPELSGTFGMVASTHWLASAAGMAVLERGGNAFDAAAAVGFMLHVVEPHMCGPGGEVPVIFTTPGDAEPTVLCGQGVAPAAASIEQLAGLDLVPGTGLLAATVPGAVGAWLTLLRDHGSLPLRDILGYAIGYAESGHVPVPRVLETIGAVESLFRAEWRTSAEVWLPMPEPGGLLRNPALAGAYRRLLAEAEAAGAGREAQLEAAITAWYQGFVAEAIDKFCRTPVLDDSGEHHAGLLTGQDCATWRPGYEPPVRHTSHGWTVYKVGPWSQGPTLLQQLAMLDALGEVPEPGSADLVHRVTEVAKLAFADREAWYGDTPDVPIEALLAPEYARDRAALAGETASLELRPGAPGNRVARLPRHLTEDRPDPVPLVQMGGLGEPTISRYGTTRGDTCHVDVADRWGNMISASPSGGWLQSSPTIPELGFCLGTRAQMFWLEPGLPASLVPGRRPRSTLSPSFARRDGRMLAFGTPGGDQQDQWQLGFFLNHAVFGLDLQAAIDAPAWHTTAFPSSFYPRQTQPGGLVVESRLGEPALAGLAARGHRVTRSDPWSLGRLSAVARDSETGILRAAANPRGMQGYAIGR
ncbi:gamma-glutamyltransferase family protein [Actinophytocola sp.]|uniref:gamma-glutamyltransferase family protein n=1 Tax=Actinophytocola sp. TaxID=1872138 RepID=UPI002D7E5424|nr:gamma-glutamyltransferase [Actinophytocola sp.]HET9142348.1 gamma-glutamyltransferase [Actinophytocola sp.]